MTSTTDRTPTTKAKAKMVVVLLYRGHKGYDFDPRLWWMQKCKLLHLDHKPRTIHEEINNCYHQHAHGLIKKSDLSDSRTESRRKAR